MQPQNQPTHHVTYLVHGHLGSQSSHIDYLLLLPIISLDGSVIHGVNCEHAHFHKKDSINPVGCYI